MEQALTDLFTKNLTAETLKIALLKLLQEDAVAKNLTVDENKWVQFNSVLYEQTIVDLDTTSQKIEDTVNKSQGALEMDI